MAKKHPLVWIDESADGVPVLTNAPAYYQAKKLFGAPVPNLGQHGGITLPPPKPAPRPTARWRSEVRPVPRLKAGPSEVQFHTLRLDRISVSDDALRLSIDGTPWRGRWVILNISVDQQYHEPSFGGSIFQSFLASGPATVTVEVQNFNAPGQSMTFVLPGGWAVTALGANGSLGYSFQRGKPESNMFAPY